MSKKIITSPSNKAYRDGWDRIFGNKGPVFKCLRCNDTGDVKLLHPAGYDFTKRVCECEAGKKIRGG